VSLGESSGVSWASSVGWAMGIGDWGSSVSWGSGVGDWGGVNLGNGWGSSVGDWSCVDLGNGDSWGLSVNDGVESVDGVSGVGHGTDGTIGLDKGVLSLDNITVAALLVVLGITGQTVLDGVSVVVLWVSIVWLWLGNDSLDDWGGISDWGSSDGEGWLGISQGSSGETDWASWGGDSDGHNGQEGHNLEHDAG